MSSRAPHAIVPTMPDAGPASFPVTLEGFHSGLELDGPGTLQLLDAGVRFTAASGESLVRTDEICGVEYGDGRLILHLVQGDVIEAEGTGRLAAVARDLLARACVVPELTLPLRALGARPGLPGAEEQARFFAALLAARRRAERTTDWHAALGAFDAAILRAEMTGALRDFARARFPRRPPDRRALEAALLDALERLDGPLAALAIQADEVRSGPASTCVAAWRRWTEAVRALFVAADRCWLEIAPLLARHAPVEKRRWWRRLFAAAMLVALAASESDAQLATVRVRGVAADSIRRAGFDVVEVRRDEVLVVAGSAERDRLAARGWIGSDVGILPHAPAADRLRALGATPPVVYRSFDDPVRGVRAFLDSLASANPRVHLDTLGFTHESRPIIAVKIGEATDSDTRPNVLFLATYHAREWVATEMALRLLLHLSRANPDARVDSLVQRRDIWIVPVANPDGYQYTFTNDRLWRKNRRPIDGRNIGVDLNRNHSSHWGYDDAGSSPDPASEVYRGPSAASEEETRAIEAFHAAHPPVFSVSYHTYTGLILWPPGWEEGLLPGDLGIFRALSGTDERPAVVDHLPGPERSHYHPAPGWNLYPTNGDYTDFAYEQYGTLAVTPELTSGYEHGAYYGFVFPDDEGRLQTVFLDNLPFALDLLDAASDPLSARGRATGIRHEPIALESLSPEVRVRAPKGLATTLRADESGIPYVVDNLGRGTFTHRLIGTAPVRRPSRIDVEAGTHRATYRVLASNGAEIGDEPWVPEGFRQTTEHALGAGTWFAAFIGRLRSPPIVVPADVDTLSVVYWTRYEGNGFSLDPHGEVLISNDDGRSWSRTGSVSGNAPALYTERVVIPGVAGQTVRIEFRAVGMPWWVDEIAVVAHGGSGTPVARANELLPSENPVRGNAVHLTWPFGVTGGELLVYDYAGRLVSRVAVPVGSEHVRWDVAASGARNGVYVAVARAGSRVARRRLFVVRRGAGS